MTTDELLSLMSKAYSLNLQISRILERMADSQLDNPLLQKDLDELYSQLNPITFQVGAWFLSLTHDWGYHQSRRVLKTLEAE